MIKSIYKITNLINNAVFVCSNTKAMETKAHVYGLTGILFMSYHEFNKVIREKGYLDRNVVIDDLKII